MKLESLAKIFEMVGVAVVITSLYFIYEELKLTKQSIRSGSNVHLLGLSFQIREDIAINSEFAELLVKADSAFSSLDKAELKQYYAHISRSFDIWEQAYFSRGDSFIHDDIWHAWDCSYRELFSRAGPKHYWYAKSNTYSSKFKSYINQKVIQSKDNNTCS